MFLIRTLRAEAWLAVVAAPAFAAAADTLPGPYYATVERVVDGDTLAVRVAVWLQHDVGVLVRLRGIDAPELRGECDDEKRRAEQATLALTRIVAEGPLKLTAIEGDKYFGRIVADATNVRGRSVAASLVAGGFARAYDGGTRASWCASVRGDAEAALVANGE